MEQMPSGVGTEVQTSWADQKPAEYEVFLSFRGPDVRESFADCLYSYLVRSKIRTFRDEEELRKGESIGPSLVQAITESKIYIPILTKSYAASKWCLQELAKMVQCWKQGEGHIILPIFYLMNPRDVRHQAGLYEEAFEEHSKKHDPETVQEWRTALQEVGQMKGWHVTESDGQGAVIDEVFSKVELHLRSNYTLVTEELVGIGCHVQEVMRLLNLDSGVVKVVGIHGIGGMGKTTIAKAVYDSICTGFNRCCFLENVREMLSKTDGTIALQSKFISSILRDDAEVKDASEGVNIIRERVCKYKVLVVLDDVDDRFDFGQIFGKLGHFSSESRFIITTRNTRVLELLQEYKLYEPKEMSQDHSLQLFSMHAFRMHRPPKDYEILCGEFIEVAAKLPLALTVLGSLLFLRDIQFWEEKLLELKQVPATTNKVQQRLKISYNELTASEKHIFLDIACFFIGEHKEWPFHMWRACDFYPESGIRTLVHRSLIKIDEGNRFWMHDLLRDLGRAIVIEEDVKRPWRRSRIWSNEDAQNMLKNGEGTDQVEMLRVDMTHEHHCEYTLTDKKFEKLSALKYLNVMYGSLEGDFSRILPDIRWISLYNCTKVPTDLNLNKVVVLDLQASNVTDDWEGWKRVQVANNLKVMNLYDCHRLRRVPDLSQCGSLESIDLGCCFWMKGVLDIGSFRNLKVVRLLRTGITELTGDIGKLQKLQDMVMGKLVWRAEEVLLFPTALKRLVISSPKVPNLMELKDLEELCFLDCDTAPEIPASIWQLSKLKILELHNCNCSGGLTRLPSSLTRLIINWFRGLTRLPNLANLNHLVELRLFHLELSGIHGLGELRVLETLDISDCLNLDNLGGLESLVLLEELTLTRCGRLESLPSLSNLIKLGKLVITECPFLSEVQGLGELRRSLVHLEASGCGRLANIRGLESLEALESLELQSVKPPKVVDVDMDDDDEWMLAMVQDDYLVQFERFPDLSCLQELKQLHVTGWRHLPAVVTGLESLKSLQTLVVTACRSVRRLADVSGLENLERLDVSWCVQLVEVAGLDRLKSLQSLVMRNCKSIRWLPDVSGLENLNELDASGCVQLVEVTGLERLKSLKRLNLSGCWSIRELPDLSGLKNLYDLDVSECRELVKVTGLENLGMLTELNMCGCKSLKELPDMSGLKKLRGLNLKGCSELKKVKGLEGLEELWEVEMGKRLKAKVCLKSAAWSARHLSRTVRRVRQERKDTKELKRALGIESSVKRTFRLGIELMIKKLDEH
ncbi:Disease resistance protein L6 [Linum grandiflorum]